MAGQQLTMCLARRYARAVSRFRVRISEMSRSLEVPAPADEPGPAMRDKAWTFEAADAGDAQRLALNAWEEHFGGPPALQNRVEVTPLD